MVSGHTLLQVNLTIKTEASLVIMETERGIHQLPIVLYYDGTLFHRLILPERVSQLHLKRQLADLPAAPSPLKTA